MNQRERWDNFGVPAAIGILGPHRPAIHLPRPIPHNRPCLCTGACCHPDPAPAAEELR
jgi:hypothetical protein